MDMALTSSGGSAGHAGRKPNEQANRQRVMRGVEVSAIGFGCMSLSNVYGPSDDEAGIAFIREAIDRA